MRLNTKVKRQDARCIQGGTAAFWPRLWRDKRGNVSLVVAASLIPLTATVGLGIDISRLVHARETLRSATNAAALAGATYFTDASKGPAAVITARRYFDKYSVSPELTIPPSDVTVTAIPSGGGTTPNKVTVTATGTIPTTIMKLVGYSTMTIKSTAVAGIDTVTPPTLHPIITAAPGTGSASQILSHATATIGAGDWNTAFMYPVPLLSGTPDYRVTSMPLISTMYEIGSTCGSVDTSWSPSARCNGLPRAIPAQNVNFPYYNPNQPLAFLFLDMNNGADSAPGGWGYGPNQYGTRPGDYHIMSTAPLSQVSPEEPSSISDNSVNTLKVLDPATFANLNQGPTTFTAQKKGYNCAVQIEDVTGVTSLPTYPPSRRAAPDPAGMRCFKIGDAADDLLSGRALANLSCNQIGGRTLMYWWNDMGFDKDDYDYRNLTYLLSCTAGVTNPDNGTYGNTPPAPPQIPPTAKLLE